MGDSWMEMAIFWLLLFMFVEVALLDPLFQFVQYQHNRYGRLSWLRWVLKLVTFDTSKWEPDDPTAPGPLGGVMFTFLLLGVVALCAGYFTIALLFAAGLALLFAGMHYRDLNKMYTHGRQS